MRRILIASVLLGCVPEPQPQRFEHHVAVNCFTDEQRLQHNVVTGRWFDLRRIVEMHPDDSTIDDAICVLGRPTTTSIIGELTMLSWNYGQVVRGRQPYMVFVSISFNIAHVMNNQVSVTVSGDPVE